MDQLATFAVLSLGPGALVGALGLGLVLTFRSSGVINFAVGATATFVTYTFFEVRSEGALFGIPLTADGSRVDTSIALLISLMVAAALGLLQWFLVYRPLRAASPLAKVVASTGVMLVLNAIIVLRFSADVHAVPPILPATPVTIAAVSVPMDRFALLVTVIVLTTALWAVYRYTKFGLASRAVADNRRGALLIGLGAGRLEAVSWIGSSVLVGLIGILAGPAQGLSPTGYTLLVIPALGAALLGGFNSFVWVAATGLAISIVQSFVTFAQGQDWFPKIEGTPIPGVKELIPFLVIAVVMSVRGSSLPDRRSALPVRLPRAPRPTHVLWRFGVAIIIAIALLSLASFGWRQAFINSMIGAIICLSLVIVTGFIGQITFAQLAVAGVAGFLTSKLALVWGLGFPLGPIIAVLVATLVSILISLPALRMRGMQLAVITLAGAVAIGELWFKNSLLGGGLTASVIPDASFLGVKLGSGDSFWNGDGAVPSPGFGLFILIVLVVLSALVVNLRRSATGSRMLAIRADEAAASAAGVNVAATKLAGFAIAGAIAAIAGVLYGYNFGSVTAGRFDALTSIAFLAVAYLGGITTVTGAVLAGTLAAQGLGIYAITKVFGISSDFQPLLAGVAVIATVIANPDGIAGFFRDRVTAISARLARPRSSRAVREETRV